MAYISLKAVYREWWKAKAYGDNSHRPTLWSYKSYSLEEGRLFFIPIHQADVGQTLLGVHVSDHD